RTKIVADRRSGCQLGWSSVARATGEERLAGCCVAPRAPARSPACGGRAVPVARSLQSPRDPRRRLPGAAPARRGPAEAGPAARRGRGAGGGGAGGGAAGRARRRAGGAAGRPPVAAANEARAEAEVREAAREGARGWAADVGSTRPAAAGAARIQLGS